VPCCTTRPWLSSVIVERTRTLRARRGDEHDRLAQLAEDAHELHLEVGARDGVERPQRLVEQEDRGIQHQRPHEAHALPLSTLSWCGNVPSARLEVHQRGEGVKPRRLTRRGPARGARRQHDVARAVR